MLSVIAGGRSKGNHCAGRLTSVLYATQSNAIDSMTCYVFEQVPPLNLRLQQILVEVVQDLSKPRNLEPTVPGASLKSAWRTQVCDAYGVERVNREDTWSTRFSSYRGL